MHASILSVHGPPWPHVKPQKLLNFDFNADPDPAFLSNADPDPDPASQNNTDPGPDRKVSCFQALISLFLFFRHSRPYFLDIGIWRFFSGGSASDDQEALIDPAEF
jgi:hypothetical protein